MPLASHDKQALENALPIALSFVDEHLRRGLDLIVLHAGAWQPECAATVVDVTEPANEHAAETVMAIAACARLLCFRESGDYCGLPAQAAAASSPASQPNWPDRNSRQHLQRAVAQSSATKVSVRLAFAAVQESMPGIFPSRATLQAINRCLFSE